MAAIRGVLFDKDGTLFDFQATWGAWTYDYLLDLAGGDRDRAYALGRVVGFDFDHQTFRHDSPIIAGTPAEIAKCLLPHLPGASPISLISRMNALAAEVRLSPAVSLQPLLESLRVDGIRVGVATNDAEMPARAHLAVAGVAHLIDFVAGCDSGFGAKPAPGQLLAFADTLGLPPHEVVMVGDSRHDLIAGRAAGMHVVGVLTGVANEAELRPLAEVVLPDVGYLPGWLAEVRVQAEPLIVA